MAREMSAPPPEDLAVSQFEDAGPSVGAIRIYRCDRRCLVHRMPRPPLIRAGPVAVLRMPDSFGTVKPQ